MDDLYRVHMLLKHCFLLLDQVKVLSHEQAHCHSMEAEAVFDVVVGIAHEKPTCFRQLSEATSKVATLLFLEGFQMVRCSFAALIEHELCDRGEVSDDPVAVVLELS